MVEPVFEQLNDEQRVAVEHEGGPLLVLAGAGTGKTATLTARVVRLLDRGVPAERILLLTFTRRAAREMLARAAAGRGRRPPRGGTFHSVAHRVVSTQAAALGLARGFGVLDPADAADLLDLVRDEHGLAATGRRVPRKGTLLDLYSRTVNTQTPLSETVAEAAPWCADLTEQLADLFRAYVARKRARALLDFDDLLLYWRAAIRDDVLGRRMAATFDHVLVDEYQDVNGLQVDVVRGLCPGAADGLTVVGDDAQAIYGFRGSSAEHILDVQSLFPGTTIVRLVRNYRSTQPILDLADAVWAGATRRYAKALRATRPGAGRPELVDCDDELTQADEVCHRVLEARECGVRLADQAVLFRAGRHGDLLELELTRRRIPFVKYGGLRYLEAAHVKDLLALYRLADNPADEMAWFRLLQLLDGVGPATARAVTGALRLELTDPLSRWGAAAAALPDRCRAAADALVEVLRAAGPARSAAERAETLRAALVPLVRGRYPDAEARLADLDRLAAAAAEHGDLRTFVVELALDPPASTGTDAIPPHLDEDYLVLSTVHSAKGLEWDVVHVLHATEGGFPSDLALSTRDGLDEERRLFYVALTRARTALHVYAPLRYVHHPRGRDDRHSYARRSRFLDAAALACCERTRAAAPGTGRAAPAMDVPARVSVDLDALWA
jgi:DNA helicase-2/ATP-dependent DNA helicase PcrA